MAVATTVRFPDQSGAVAPVHALPDIVERLLILIALITLLYLVAPTAQQLVALSVRFRIGAGGRP